MDEVDDENENEDFCAHARLINVIYEDDDDDDEKMRRFAWILGGGIRGRRRKRLVPVAVFENEWLWKCQSNCPSK